LSVPALEAIRASEPIGTGFTYQGQLKRGGVPVNAPPPNLLLMLRGGYHRRMKIFAGGVALILVSQAGCVSAPRPSLEQKQRAMVYVLPGIEGESRFNINIAKGLIRGGVDGAVTVHDWTTRAGSLGWFLHLADERRNRSEAIRLARRIIKYQETFPNRPVYLVAHSGGAGIALMALERLPHFASVDAVVLLAAAVSPDHNLAKALAHTRRGIWNFYSNRDVGFLMLGTSLFGTIDRAHGPSAGAVGFSAPVDTSDEADRLYVEKLHQIPYVREMADDGNLGGHGGWTNPGFVARWVAPIILDRPLPLVQNIEAGSR